MTEPVPASEVVMPSEMSFFLEVVLSVKSMVSDMIVVVESVVVVTETVSLVLNAGIECRVMTYVSCNGSVYP